MLLLSEMFTPLNSERCRSAYTSIHSLMFFFFLSFPFFLFFFIYVFCLGIQLSTDPEVMLDQVQNKWQVIVKHYAGVISLAGIGLLLAAIIPIAGVFVCCCRCAGMILLPIDPSLAETNFKPVSKERCCRRGKLAQWLPLKLR